MQKYKPGQKVVSRVKIVENIPSYLPIKIVEIYRVISLLKLWRYTELRISLVNFGKYVKLSLVETVENIPYYLPCKIVDNLPSYLPCNIVEILSSVSSLLNLYHSLG